MRKVSGQTRRWCSMVVSLCMLACMASCSDSGDDGADAGIGGLSLSTYNFILDLDLDEDAATPFRIEVNTGEVSALSIPLSGMPGNPLGSDFNGSMELAQENGAIVVASITVDDTTVFRVDVSAIWTGITLTLDVTDPIVFEGGDDPADGGFTMSNGTDSIDAAFYKDGGAFMVTLSTVAAPVTLDAFKAYSDDTGVDVLLRQASIAYHMIELLFDQVNFIAGMIVKIEEGGLGTEQGDAGLGTLTLTCTSGTVAPGADFSVVFDNFWMDDPDDDIDTLIDGSVNLMGYFRTETNDELTDVGFGWGDNAGVFYGANGMAFYETEDSGGGLTQELTHTVYGSYEIIFTKS